MQHRNTLKTILSAATETTGRPMKDFTVLSSARDPYRLDTPAGHERGKWLADAYREVCPDGGVIHLRGLHYRLVGRVNLPNGKPYINDDITWTWMSEQAAKAARFLGYLPWEAIRDARNAPPAVFADAFEYPSWSIETASVEVYLPHELEPRLSISGDMYRQSWQQVIIAEKQGVQDVLLPIARRYRASLVLPGGELSDQMLYNIMRDAATDGRPLAIHQLGDFDPAGHQMAVSTARTAQALRDSQFPDMTVRVHAVALTRDHCAEWDLPSTPLKETERRASRWKEAMGREQTELDAAVALVADAFAAAVSESLAQYHDHTLAGRARELREELEAEANARLAGTIGPETLEAIRIGAETKLGDLQHLVEQVNDALRIDIESLGGLHVEPLRPMYGETAMQSEPLFDSSEDWGAATRRLVDRKAYTAEVSQ